MCNNKMFCYQCQETAQGKGCTVIGVCGKTAKTAKLQDLLIYTTKGVALYSSILRKEGKVSQEINRYLINSLFITITNANFDDNAIIEEIRKGIKIRKELELSLNEENKKEVEKFSHLVNWQAETDEEIVEFSNEKKVGILRTENEDVKSLRELLIYGLKGMSAYAEHAMNLGKTQDEIFAFIEKGLLATEDDSLTGEELTALVLECGSYGVKVMAILHYLNLISKRKIH